MSNYTFIFNHKWTRIATEWTEAIHIKAYELSKEYQRWPMDLKSAHGLASIRFYFKKKIRKENALYLFSQLQWE